MSKKRFAQRVTWKSRRRPNVEEVRKYVWPLFVACSRVGRVEPEFPHRLKPRFLCLFGGAKAPPFQSKTNHLTTKARPFTTKPLA